MMHTQSRPPLPAACLIALTGLFLGSTGFARGAAPLESGALEHAAALAAEERCDEALGVLDRSLEERAVETREVALRAECLRRLDRLDEAWDGYRMLGTMLPGDSEAWFWMGTIDRWRGRHEEAVAEFGRALELAGDHPDASKGRARSLMALDREAEAERDLRGVLARHRHDAEAAQLLARLQSNRGESQAARRTLASVVSGSELMLGLGDLELAEGRLAAASDSFRRATLGSGQSAEAWRRVGDVEFRRGRDAEALDAYRRALEIEPDHLGSLYRVGVLATRAGRSGEALAAWDAMLELAPENVGALVGKARVLFYRGDTARALTLANQALDLEPDNGEALTLRASIFSASGRLREAGADYEQALAREPDNVDARIGYDRYTDTSSWGARGLIDNSRLVEGLDDEGAVVNGVPIEPTRIEYLTEGVEAFWRSHVSGRAGLAASLSQRRETVNNLDGGFAIYDFDVFEAGAGLDHHFAGGFRASWRVGGARYEPREAGSIVEDDRFSGNLAFGWSGGRDTVTAELSHRPSIYRGFAGDTQFEIFDHLSMGAAWSRVVGASTRLRASASASDYGSGADGSQLYGNLAVEWRRGRRFVELGLRQAPFPKRFLTEESQLDFLDSTAAYGRLESPLGAGFRLGARGEYGRIGAAPRLIELGDQKFDGPEERNTRLFALADVRWSPRRLRQIALGARHSTERFDFRSADYNTLDTDATTLFVDFAGGEGTRFRYGLRYGRSRVSDDRDPGYFRDDVYLRLETEVGRSPAPGLSSVWLGFEGRLAQNTLEGDDQSYDEEAPYLRAYLKVPF
jgi:tetratricopeptide (TPR) repeat protein